MFAGLKILVGIIAMNPYLCQHCGANLNKGDIFEHFISLYNDARKAMKAAALYGWSETNKIHFNRSIIVQPDREGQHTIYPYCKKTDPFILPGEE